MPTPTVDDILRRTLSGTLWGAGETLHQWRTESGAIEVSSSELRPILEQAYDPFMPDWLSLISYDCDGGWHVA
jgi:hypothetical protein